MRAFSMQMRFRQAKAVRWALRPVHVVVVLSLLLGAPGPSSLVRIDDSSAAAPRSTLT